MSWLSSLLGQDAQHQAGVNQKQANQYNQQAGATFGNLTSAGSGLAGAAGNQVNSLIAELGQVAGLPGYQPPSYAPSGKIVNVSGIPGVSSVQTNVANPSAGEIRQAASGVNPAVAPNNGYSAQQNQQLNTLVAGVNQAGQSAASQFAQEMAARGLNPNDPAVAEGIASIQQHFAGLSAQVQTNFAMQVQQEQMQTLSQLLGIQVGQEAAGFGLQEAGAAGQAGLGAGYQNQANVDQQAASNALSGILSLAGFGLGGGFSKPSTPQINLGGSSPGYFDPFGALVGTSLSPAGQTLSPAGGDPNLAALFLGYQ